MKNQALISIFLFLVLAAVFIWIFSQTGKQTTPAPVPTPLPSISSTPIASSSATLGAQTKTTDCHVNGPLPDQECTPGAVFPNVTKDQICVSGYAKSVRNVSTEEKDLVYKEYDIVSHKVGEYEVDHLISLELGGSNDISNLWPEAASPKPGFHEKDMVENYLHEEVCSGKISLSEAQHEISTDWLNIYNQITR